LEEIILKMMVKIPEIEVHLIKIPFFNSMYRFGNDLFVVPQVFEQEGSDAPMILLKTSEPLAEAYTQQFSQIINWKLAQKLDSNYY
jgi:hypothetical protein